VSELQKLSKTESELLGELLSGKNESLEVSIPDDLSPKKAVQWSMAAASLLDRRDSEMAVLLCAMGRLHYLARINPAILKEAGVETVKDYEDNVLKCRQHRATIWKYSSAYREFPAMTPDEAGAIGTTNLVLASKVAKGKSPRQKAEIIEKAKESPEKFREFLEGPSGHAAPGDTTGATFPLYGSAAQIGEFKEWLADKRFMAYAESNHAIEMVLAAIHGSSCEWPLSGDVPEDAVYLRQEPVKELAAAPEAVGKDGW
jgi:hypothetical protein